MPNRVKCGSCDSVFQVPDGYSGSRGKCPKCGVVVELPEVKPAPPKRAAAAAPPKKRPSGAAAKAPAEPAVRKPPVKGAAHARSENSASGSFTASASAGTGSAAAIGRYRRRSGFPVWAWVLLAVGVVAAVGLGGYAAFGPDDSVAVNDPEPPDDDGPGVDKPGDDEPPDDDGDPGFLKEKYAKTIKEARDAIVKLEIFTSEGVHSGTGFFIKPKKLNHDDKEYENAWVVTNCHVMEGATTSARASTVGGTNHPSQEFEIAGIIVERPDYDLAIVQLAGRPVNMTMLDVSYDKVIAPETEIDSWGHPKGANFQHAFGVVNAVWKTSELPEGTQKFLSQKKVPSNFRWIQHNVEIQPGSSGGPIFVVEGGRVKVVGVNTFINAQDEYRFASHIENLQELFAKAKPSDLKPLPSPSGDGTGMSGALVVDIDAEKMQKLYDEAEAFGFKPEKPEQYETLAELAKMMTFARRAQTAHDLVPEMSEEDIKKSGELAEQLFGKLGEMKFGEDHAKAVNQLGAKQLAEAWKGVFLFAQVAYKTDDARLLLLQIQGTQERFVVRLHGEAGAAAGAAQGSRWLVLGYLMRDAEFFGVAGGGHISVRVVYSQMFVKIK